VAVVRDEGARMLPDERECARIVRNNGDNDHLTIVGASCTEARKLVHRLMDSMTANKRGG
jgi:hypothetical protein